MIKDPNEVVCSSVLGLLVKDPRLAMPKKKSFNQINEQNQKIDARKSQLIKQGYIFLVGISTLYNKIDLIVVN